MWTKIVNLQEFLHLFMKGCTTTEIQHRTKGTAWEDILLCFACVGSSVRRLCSLLPRLCLAEQEVRASFRE